MNTEQGGKVTASNGETYNVKEFALVKCPVCGCTWFTYCNTVKTSVTADVNGLWITEDGSVLYPNKTVDPATSGGTHSLKCHSCGTVYTSALPLIRG